MCQTHSPNFGGVPIHPSVLQDITTASEPTAPASDCRVLLRIYLLIHPKISEQMYVAEEVVV